MENVGALELPHSTTSDQTPQDHGREQQFLPHKTGKAVGRAEGSKPCRLSAAPRTPRAESTAATLLLSVSQQSNTIKNILGWLENDGSYI